MSEAYADNVAKVGDVEYATLQAAFNAATDGQTVTLLSDYDATSKDMSGGKRQFVIKKSITFDGAGHTLTTKQKGIGVGNVNSDISNNIDVTIKDITINNTSSDARCIDTRGYVGSLTLDGVTLNTEGASGCTQPLTIGGSQSDAQTVNISKSTIQTNSAGTAYYAIVTFNPVNMTISNSTVKGWACIYAKGADGSAGSAGSVFTIKNNSTLVSSNAYSGVSNSFGAFVLEDNNIEINITDTDLQLNNSGDQTQAIVLYTAGKSGSSVNLGEGNNVTLTSPGNYSLTLNNTANNTFSITGGTYNFNPTEILEEGYKVVENSDGTYTVKEIVYVAAIGETKYETLQEAVDAAEAGATIDILKDFTLTTVTTSPNAKYNVNVNKSVTINGNGHTITSSEGKRALALTGEGNNITLKDLTVVNNKADWCMGILNNLTCTLDGTTIDGSGYSGGYNQPLTIGSISEEGRVTLNVTNGSVIKTNDNGTAHYSIIAWHPADITVTDSKLIGWSNVYLKSAAEGSTVNIDNSVLESQGLSGNTNSFAAFVVESNNSTIEVKDTKVTTEAVSDTYQTLVSFVGSGNVVKLLGTTTYETNDMTYGAVTFNWQYLTQNKIYLDDTTKQSFESYFDGSHSEVIDPADETGLYPVSFKPEIMYFWAMEDGTYQGTYCDFALPFTTGLLSDGQFISLMKDVTLTSDITCALESGTSFNFLLGDYSVTKGDYSVSLNVGVTVYTDKQTDIFSSADADYKVVETELTEGDFSYQYTLEPKTYICAIGDTKYETLQDAVDAAGTTAATITLLTDAATDGVITANGAKVQAGQDITFDLNGLTYNVDKTVGSAGTEYNGFQLLKGSTVKFTNGTVTSNTASILLQNYSDLTLKDVTVNAGSANYAVSNNFGSLTVTGETYINAKEDGMAFDLWYGMYATYDDGISVVFDENFTGAVTGKVEYGHANRVTDENWREKASLEIKEGKFDIDFVAASTDALNGANITISGGVFSAEPAEEYLAEGYVVRDNTDEATKDAYPYAVMTPEEAGEFVLTDGDNYNRTEDTAATKLTYKRTFDDNIREDKYQCWFIPFDYTIKAEDLENFEFYKLHMIAGSKESGVVEDVSNIFIYITLMNEGETLKANRPYVIKPTATLPFDYQFVEEGDDLVLLKKNDDSRLNLETAENEFDFYGVCSDYTTTKERECYTLNKKGMITPVIAANTTLNSYRWIMKATPKDNDGYSNFTFVFVEGDPTVDGISEQFIDNEIDGIYTSNGMKIDNMTKGINIVKYKDGSTKKIYIK